MNLVFVHGWSVVNTNTYGDLPKKLTAHVVGKKLKLNIRHIYLGQYVSFNDEVTLSDVARAFDHALREELPDGNGIADFSCISHSTGGPVVRQWLEEFQPSSRWRCPLKHSIMLAPATHGAPLAVIGKQRLGRIKAWFEGVEPGQSILEWLSLGSDGQWQLNGSHFKRGNMNRPYEFVLTGAARDPKLYDFMNSYLDEPGSDGIVRVAGANMNGRLIELTQTSAAVKGRGRPKEARTLELTKTHIADETPLCVLPEYSHSGTSRGIMASKARGEAGLAAVVTEVMACLDVSSKRQYDRRFELCEAQTNRVQAAQSAEPRYCQIVISIRDDQGHQFDPGDYDFLLLSGPQYEPDKLPGGFFRDRQMNCGTGRLVFYLNYDALARVHNIKLGLRVIPRPADGFAYYRPAEFHSGKRPLTDFLRPNETSYFDIKLTREVDHNLFRLRGADQPAGSFKGTKPARTSVD